MSSLPTGATETYVDVLRTLGVTDAELRRHHDVAADEPLRAAIAADIESPTDDLLVALAATGRVLDPVEGDATESAEAEAEEPGAAGATPWSPADAERLAAALGRFGYVLQSSSVGDDLELVAYDAVRDEVTRVRAAPEWDAVLEALAGELLEPAGVELVPLLDGRTLLVDARQLERLRVAYGPRIEPFETPLLAPEAAEAPSAGEGPGVVGGDWTGGAAAIERSRSDASEDAAASAAAGRSDAHGGASTDDEIVEATDPDATTGDGVPASAAGADAVDPSLELDDDRIGGGPDRTVSTSGIDDVFDQLESDAEPEESAGPGGPVTTTSSADDPLDGWSGPSSDDEGTLAGGGPKRSVSRTSADDILDRASAEPDFETIASEHRDPDPDAVADDAADVSELAAAVADVQSDPDAREPTVQELIDAAAGDEEFDLDGVGERTAEVLDRAREELAGDEDHPERDEELLERLESASRQ